jgi:hypothetical protein
MHTGFSAGVHGGTWGGAIDNTLLLLLLVSVPRSLRTADKEHYLVCGKDLVPGSWSKHLVVNM